jgi:protein-S-isoprenylcysteine O-methyltransferase Ste14
MSLIPAFKLGLWNAWILKLLGILVVAVTGSLSNKAAMEKFGEKLTVPHTKIEETSERLISLLALPFILYSFFLPLKLGTLWFYVGISICFLALIIAFSSVISFTTTPLDELITKSIYKFSRNPVCLAGFLLDLGIGLACTSWVFILYAIVDLVLMNTMLKAEERFLLKKYGEEYREYMNRTSKWIGIPKSRNKL